MRLWTRLYQEKHTRGGNDGFVDGISIEQGLIHAGFFCAKRQLLWLKRLRFIVLHTYWCFCLQSKRSESKQYFKLLRLFEIKIGSFGEWQRHSSQFFNRWFHEWNVPLEIEMLVWKSAVFFLYVFDFKKCGAFGFCFFFLNRMTQQSWEKQLFSFNEG